MYVARLMRAMDSTESLTGWMVDLEVSMSSSQDPAKLWSMMEAWVLYITKARFGQILAKVWS